MEFTPPTNYPGTATITKVKSNTTTRRNITGDCATIDSATSTFDIVKKVENVVAKLSTSEFEYDTAANIATALEGALSFEKDGQTITLTKGNGGYQYEVSPAELNALGSHTVIITSGNNLDYSFSTTVIYTVVPKAVTIDPSKVTLE